MRALMEKWLVKLENFNHAESNGKYAYLLTPAGIEEKTRITLGFLKQKQAEYDAIKLEIDALQQEIKTIGDGARLIKIGLRPLFNLKIINLNNKLCEAAGRFAGR